MCDDTANMASRDNKPNISAGVTGGVQNAAGSRYIIKYHSIDYLQLKFGLLSRNLRILLSKIYVHF